MSESVTFEMPKTMAAQDTITARKDDTIDSIHFFRSSNIREIEALLDQLERGGIENPLFEAQGNGVFTVTYKSETKPS